MDEELARKILEFKRNYGYIREIGSSETHKPDLIYRIRARNSKEYKETPEHLRIYFTLDLSIDPEFYSTIDGAEDELYSSSETIRFMVNYEPRLEAFDHNLPDDQNLWHVYAQSHLNLTYANRVFFAGFKGMEVIVNNKVNEESKKFISSTLEDNDSFLWYYDIIVNRRFIRKVYIDNSLLRSVSTLFALYGKYFLDTFVGDDLQISTTDKDRPQILLTMTAERHNSNYPYVSLVEFLNEEKLRRRL